jgi:predicted Fe-S protein YdhL (DUF1289 family)
MGLFGPGPIVFPCDRCGKLAPQSGVCPGCGHTRVDEGDEIVQWLAAIPPEQRRDAVRARIKPWPHIVMRIYPAWDRLAAHSQFEPEAALLAEAGYEPVAETWVSPVRTPARSHCCYG